MDCDIDLGGATVKGYNNGCFDSNFDGQGHTISNFTVKTTYSDNAHYCGLFPYITGGCYVKNLIVKNATSVGNVGMVATIVGAAYDNATVENCHAENCTVIGKKKTASVVGYIGSANVKNCSATDCNIYCANTEAGEVVGFNDNGTVTGITFENVTVETGVTAAVTMPTSAIDGDVTLMNDITGTAQTQAIYTGAKAGFVLTNGTFDGNGKTITITENGNTFGIQTSGGTIKNVTIKSAFRGVVINQPTEDVYIDNVRITDCGYGFNTAEHAAKRLIVTNSTIGGWNSWAGLSSASFANCSFVKGSYFNNDVNDQYLRPFVTSTFENCDFVEGMHFDLSKLNGATVTFTDCTCNGVTLTANNVYTYLHIYLDNNDTEPTCAADLAGRLIFN